MRPAHPATLLVFAPSASSGGPLRYLEEGLPSIAAAWDGRVVVAVPARSVDRLGSAADVEVVSLTSTGRGGRAGHFLRSSLQARRLRRAYRPAVTYCLGNTAYAGPLAPSVTLVQNAARRRDLLYRHGPLAWYLQIIAVSIAVSAFRSRKLIAVSHYTKTLVPTRWGRRRTEVVHHGVRHFEPGAPAPRSGDTLTVTVAGSIYSYKGVELAIEALARCTNRLWELRLAGPVMELAYASRLEDFAAEQGVGERVQWLGPLAHRELLSEVSMTDVLLVVSRAEACPNLLLEAATVRPDGVIVGVEFPWNAEYRDLFDATCPADRLHELLDEVPLESPANVVERRREAISQYSWPQTAARTVQVLRAAAGFGTP
ncbi:MAG: glycosyltransferase [Acidimicrobiales bacterium]